MPGLVSSFCLSPGGLAASLVTFVDTKKKKKIQISYVQVNKFSYMN